MRETDAMHPVYVYDYSGMVGSKPLRSVGPKAAMVLEELAKRKKRSIRLPEDEVWLKTITDFPVRLLSRMENRKVLYRIRKGRYVVAPHGTFSIDQAAPQELIVDLELSSQGDYFLSYLSALIAHRLTDLHSSTVFAAIRQESRYRKTLIDLPGCKLHIVRLSRFRWPPEHALQRVRALPETKEFVWSATIEQALIDSITRPDLSGGIETVITAWARALKHNVAWNKVCSIAQHNGPTTIHRTAFILRLLDKNTTVENNFPNLTGRSTNILLDRTSSFHLQPNETARDSRTGIVINVPKDHLQGWIAGAQLQ